jgi:hypothetical protein
VRRFTWSMTFLRVLPAHPFFGSANFLLVSISHLRVSAPTFELPLADLLMEPHGPFSFVYWKVKQRVVEDRKHLPLRSCYRVKLESKRALMTAYAAIFDRLVFIHLFSI